VQFGAKNMNVVGGVNPDSHPATPNLEHRNDNAVANLDAFHRLSA
jgi:hypothetical protein